MTRTLTFPSGFWWGAATSAHQIEGDNRNSDWWQFELAPGTRCAEPSGRACDSWNRWETDADLVAGLGLSAYRFSVEWARIEPTPGEIDIAALDQYARQCAGLRERGVEPMVTLMHFTLPQWVAEAGSWQDPETAKRFAAYAERVVTHLGDRVDHYFTLNEPNVIAALGWYQGRYPPGEVDDLAKSWVAHEQQREAHRLAVAAIRAAAPHAKVGLTLSMDDWIPVDDDAAPMAKAIAGAMEDPYIRLAAELGDDYLGVQCYTSTFVGPEGPVDPPPGTETNQLGYPYTPEALAKCVARVWEAGEHKVTPMVTEHGNCTDDDARRISMIGDALPHLHAVIESGVPVLGYFHWSLLDNFEWDLGYEPKLGLFEVDRTSFARTAKPSAAYYSAIARANAIEVE